MAVRTTAASVRLIFKTGLTDLEIEQFITDAAAWVDAYLVGACGDLPSSATDALYETIERYLAVAFITRRTPTLKSSKRADIAETYAIDEMGDHWFKVAAGYDPCGIIKVRFLDKPKAIFEVARGFAEEAAEESTT